MANPIGRVWSEPMMLCHHGYGEASAAVLEAIEHVPTKTAARTPDFGGSASTSRVTDTIVETLSR